MRTPLHTSRHGGRTWASSICMMGPSSACHGARTLLGTVCLPRACLQHCGSADARRTACPSRTARASSVPSIPLAPLRLPWLLLLLSLLPQHRPARLDGKAPTSPRTRLWRSKLSGGHGSNAREGTFTCCHQLPSCERVLPERSDGCDTLSCISLNVSGGR